MDLSPELVGKTYGPQAFRLDPDRVAAFREAVGHPGEGVPPTIVTAPELSVGLTSIVGDPDVDVDLAHVVHGEQEYAWSRPLVSGEELTVESTIEDVRTKGGLGFLTLRTEFRDESGRTVAVGRSTLIVRGGP